MNNKKLSVITMTLLALTVILAGCSEKIGSNNEIIHSEFLGTWIGEMNFSLFNFRSNFTMFNSSNISRPEINVSSKITKLEFTEDTLYMSITTDNETNIVTNSYEVEKNQLIFSSKFSGERANWRPPMNNSSPPFEGDVPFEGEMPFNRERPSNKRSYTYSFSPDYTVLYLDENEFIKN